MMRMRIRILEGEFLRVFMRYAEDCSIFLKCKVYAVVPPIKVVRIRFAGEPAGQTFEIARLLSTCSNYAFPVLSHHSHNAPFPQKSFLKAQCVFRNAGAD